MTTLALTRVVSKTTISSVTENANQALIETAINGGIVNENIGASAAIDVSKLSDEANSRKFLYDWSSQVSFVASGGIATNTSGLTISVSSGVFYVKYTGSLLYRVATTTATTISVTDDATKFIYMDINGDLQETDNANPSVGCIICKVVTSSGSVSSVTDYARRMPVLGDEHQIDGLELTYTSGTSITVQPGTCWIAGTKYVLPEATAISTNADSSYISGTKISGAGWVYVYVAGSGTALSVKLSDVAPDQTDAYGNAWTGGIMRYYAPSTTTYRCIGMVKCASAGGADVVMFYQQGNYIQLDTVINITTSFQAETATVVDVPSGTRKIVVHSIITSASSTIPTLTLRTNVGSGTAITIKGDSTATYTRVNITPMFIDADSKIAITTTQTGSGASVSVNLLGFYMEIRD